MFTIELKTPQGWQAYLIYETREHAERQLRRCNSNRGGRVYRLMEA